MGSYRLGEKDRERLGAHDWLPFDLLDATLDDITELSDRFGFELADWPNPFFGQVPLEAMGSADANDHRKAPSWQIHAGVWLALHAGGIPTTWDEVGRLAILRIEYRRDEEPVGKDEPSSPAESTPDPTPEPSTTPLSSTSSPA